jgi:MFS family permease
MTENPSQPPEDHRPPGPFSIPIFRMVWIASLGSNLGGLIQSVGASWMMTSLASSPAMVALVQSSTTLPIMLLSLWAGAVADNLDRRLVMLWAQVLMLAVSVALSLFAWYGLLTPWLLLGFTFLIGCGTALNGPAWQASVGDMVPRPALPGAVAMNAMGFNIARSAGPAIGGAIVAVAGAAAAFLVNAVSYLGLIAVLARWRPARPARALPRENLGAAMNAGVRYVAMSPNLRTIISRAGLFGFASSAVPALMPLVARDLVTGGPLSYGALLGSFGVGAVIGALNSGRLRERLSTEWTVRLATVTISIGAAVAGVSTWLPLTLAALLLAGAGWVVALSTLNMSVQMAAPRWVVARAVAIYQMSAFGGMAVGSWIFGEIAGLHGITVSLLLAAFSQLLGMLPGFLRPLPEVRDLNMDLLNLWSEPEIAVSIEPRSGPIVVTIEYRIAEQVIVDFLTAMNERRRIRVRDGARHWTLMRDLGEADLWVERYHVATWLDYMRHNLRRTHADADNFAIIRDLHTGPEAPRVHRMIERQTASLPFALTAGMRDISIPLTDPSGSR